LGLSTVSSTLPQGSSSAITCLQPALIQNAQKIIDANKIDYDSQLGILDSGMLDRLMLNLDVKNT